MINPVIEKLHEDLVSELGEIGLKVETGYTLADAIREGAGVTRKAEGKFIGDNGSAACALGAAYTAAVARGYAQ